MVARIGGINAVNRVAADLIGLGTALQKGRRDLLRRAVDEVARPAIVENFRTVGHGDWQELAESTLERRERQGTGDTPLVESGRGERAATARARWVITSSEARYPATWPASRWWMPLHQEGSDTHNVEFPPRPFGRLTDDDDRALGRVGLRWLDGVALRHGL
jgi:phage gpG-like protein